MKRLTLEEWNALGYRVRKGQRSVGRNEQGKALFLENQVYNKHLYFEEGRPDFANTDSSDISFEETQDMGFWG